MTVPSTVRTNRLIRKKSVFVAPAITLILLAMLPGMVLVTGAFSDQSAPLPPLRSAVSLLATIPFQPEPGPSKGKFLVASRNLRDPTFSETVVLLTEYNRHGALGLIINRPTEVKLSKVLPEVKGLEARPDILYIGGPVAQRQMSLLIRSTSQPEGAHRVLKNIYVSSSLTVLQRMIDDDAKGERFRAYAGYAGWAPGQLDRELSRGGWHVLQADAETVFDKKPSEIWPELIRRGSAQWVKLHVPGWNLKREKRQ